MSANYAATFRANYEECKAQAALAGIPSTKAQWLLFAQEWLEQASCSTGWAEVPPAALELCEGAPPTSLREAIRIVPLACKNAQLNSRARYCFEGG